jgi:hypothetical protein
MIGADVVIAVRCRLGQHCLHQAVRGAGLRPGPGLLAVTGGDLPGLPTYFLPADPQPLQRTCGQALVLSGQAKQEVAETPVAEAVPPGFPEGGGDRAAGRAGEGDELFAERIL